MCRTVKTSIPSVLNYSRVPGASGIPHILRLHQTKPKGELKNKSKMVIWHEVDLEITPSFCGGFFVWFFFFYWIQFPFQLDKPIQEVAWPDCSRIFSEIFSVTFSKTRKMFPPNTASFFFLPA